MSQIITTDDSFYSTINSLVKIVKYPPAESFMRDTRLITLTLWSPDLNFYSKIQMHIFQLIWVKCYKLYPLTSFLYVLYPILPFLLPQRTPNSASYCGGCGAFFPLLLLKKKGSWGKNPPPVEIFSPGF